MAPSVSCSSFLIVMMIAMAALTSTSAVGVAAPPAGQYCSKCYCPPSWFDWVLVFCPESCRCYCMPRGPPILDPPTPDHRSTPMPSPSPSSLPPSLSPSSSPPSPSSSSPTHEARSPDSAPAPPLNDDSVTGGALGSKSASGAVVVVVLGSFLYLLH